MSESSLIIDLSRLPVPDVVEPLDFETVLASLEQSLQQLVPEFTASVESDPVRKLLEVAAYRELLLRSRINDASRSVMLAYARGSDLDQLVAFYGIERLLISAGDPDALPPVPPVYEDDDRLRYRARLSLERFSTAGSVGSYVFHALSASPVVRDVSVSSPQPGEVLVTLLSTVEPDGVVTPELLAQVDAVLSSETVRPLTDHVTVQGAAVSSYDIVAHLVLYAGPDPELVRLNALQAVTDYAMSHRLLGHDITRSGLFAALHQPGVQNVLLTEPVSDIVVGINESVWPELITVTAEGVGE